MYIPKHFDKPQIDILHALMRAHPLATLVTLSSDQTGIRQGRAHLEALTSHHEAALPEPWHISNAPGDYIDKMMAAVVGIEISITRLLGKWKTSQNQPAQNQAGVVAGLHARGDTQSLAMAELVGKSKISPC